MNGIIIVKITAAYDMDIHTSFCSVNCCCCLLLQTTINVWRQKKQIALKQQVSIKIAYKFTNHFCLYNLSRQSHDPSPQKDMTLPVASSTTLKIKQTKRKTVDHALNIPFLYFSRELYVFNDISGSTVVKRHKIVKH